MIERLKKLVAPEAVLLLAAACCIAYWFKGYITEAPIASVDLPGHILGVEKLRDQLALGNLFYYDIHGFSGWPALHFYAFLPYLFGVFLSVLLEPWFFDSARIALHLLLVTGAALLPLSMYWAATGISQGAVKKTVPQSLTAFSCCVFGFWFLNHDFQWYGIGAAAVMKIGLFQQTFGWHLLLIYLGALSRLIRSGRYHWLLSLSLGLLFLSHSLTTVFAGYLGFMSMLWFRGRRAALLGTHLLGLALAAFWLFPMISLMGEYTAGDVISPRGDLLEMLFRYPLMALADTYYSAGLQALFDLNPINIVAMLFALLIPVVPVLRNSDTFLPLVSFVVLSVIFFNSEFVTKSIPLGLHYYRFQGYHFLIFCLFFSIIPAALVSWIPFRGIVAMLLSLVLGLSLVGTVRLPHYEREYVFEASTLERMQNEQDVLDYLATAEPKGRVYFEYFSDDDLFRPLSAHFMSSRLRKESNHDPIILPHVQQSLAHRYIAGSVRALGGKTYSTPLVFTDSVNLSDRALVNQLKSFGIKFVVSGWGALARRVCAVSGQSQVRFGRYRICKISDEKFELVRPLKKQLIGYLDQTGELPFGLVSMFFYSQQRLWENFEVVELKSLPSDTSLYSVVLVNGGTTESKKIIPIDFKYKYSFDHYKREFEQNREQARYGQAYAYLRDVVKTPAVEEVTTEFKSAKVELSEDEQEIRISELEPGKVYSVNLSYFPLWQANGATLLRGTAERMVIIPDKTSVSLKYSHSRAPHLLTGIVISIGSLVVLAILTVFGFWRGAEFA